MTLAEFFNAYIEEILKIHKSIKEGEPLSAWGVRNKYYTDLGDLVDATYEKYNIPEIVAELYDETYDLIKELPGSHSLNDTVVEKAIELTRETAKHYKITLTREKEEETKEKDEKASNEKIERIEKVLVKMSTEGQFPKIGNSTRRGKRHKYTADKKKSNPLSFKMEDLMKADPKLKEKLTKFLEKNKAGQFYVPALKRSIYISRANLDKLRSEMHAKRGGFLPLIPILAGIAAAGSVAGGAAGIAQAVNRKKAEDAAAQEEHRHNLSLEAAARGKGLKDDVVKFVQDNDLDDDLKRVVKKTLKGLATVIPMRKEGGSLILNPYKKDGGSLILNWK